jgi:hypothetical protein
MIGLIDHVGELEHAASRPLARLADDQSDAIVEQDLGFQLVSETTFRRVSQQWGEDQIDRALVELRELHARLPRLMNFKFDPRIVRSKALNCSRT